MSWSWCRWIPSPRSGGPRMRLYEAISARGRAWATELGLGVLTACARSAGAARARASSAATGGPATSSAWRWRCRARARGATRRPGRGYRSTAASRSPTGCSPTGPCSSWHVARGCSRPSPARPTSPPSTTSERSPLSSRPPLVTSARSCPSPPDPAVTHWASSAKAHWGHSDHVAGNLSPAALLVLKSDRNDLPGMTLCGAVRSGALLWRCQFCDK
mmetsp:Transcript_71961/g.192180  ORF Transcript_71961/g.192180 Transcript_71961/m.192180 type:complete len:217 (+) Transcript_71961:1348-1998(+)